MVIVVVAPITTQPTTEIAEKKRKHTEKKWINGNYVKHASETPKSEIFFSQTALISDAMVPRSFRWLCLRVYFSVALSRVVAVLFCSCVVVCVPFVYLFRMNAEKLNSILWLLLLLFRRYRVLRFTNVSLCFVFIYFYSPTLSCGGSFFHFSLFHSLFKWVSLIPCTREIDKELDIHWEIAYKIHLDSLLSSAYRTPSTKIFTRKIGCVSTNSTQSKQCVLFVVVREHHLIRDIIEQFHTVLCVCQRSGGGGWFSLFDTVFVRNVWLLFTHFWF